MELQGSITAEERKIARNWYFWLWFSPILAFPTSIVLGFFAYAIFAHGAMDYSPFWVAIPVFGAALWHLILLIPAMDKKRPFVRRHARQAMLIVAVRTFFLFILAYALFEEHWTMVLVLPPLAIWLFGTLWGQLEANRGKSTLDKWFGRREPRAVGPAAERELGLPEDADVLAWVEIVRFSQDPQERARALQALEQLGLTEQL